MADDRPEKQTVRALWAEAVNEAVRSGNEPLYLTLPGAIGRDIEVLIERGLVRRAENGAIASSDLGKVVAVEFDGAAIAALQRRFPGLKILEDKIENILHSSRITAWPDRKTRSLFRASVVNLDLNAPFECRIEHDQLTFPLVELIRKIALIHGESPTNWTLLLTLNARLHWGRDEASRLQRFLNGNFARDATFAKQSREWIGEAIYGELTSEGALEIAELDQSACQSILMTVVPKAIAYVVHRDGWRVETVQNLAYGGRAEIAPMVTWVMYFRWDPRASTDAEDVYRESLEAVHANAGVIRADGIISPPLGGE